MLSFLTRLGSHSYWSAIDPRNRVRKCKTTSIRTRARPTIKVGSKPDLCPHRYFTEHLVSALEKSLWENDLNQEPSSLLIRWLKNHTGTQIDQLNNDMSIAPVTHKEIDRLEHKPKQAAPELSRALHCTGWDVQWKPGHRQRASGASNAQPSKNWFFSAQTRPAGE
jgi:hypothetical protein